MRHRSLIIVPVVASAGLGKRFRCCFVCSCHGRSLAPGTLQSRRKKRTVLGPPLPYAKTNKNARHRSPMSGDLNLDSTAHDQGRRSNSESASHGDHEEADRGQSSSCRPQTSRDHLDSSLRLLVTLKAPGTWLAAMPARSLSIWFAATPSNVIFPFFTMM